MAKINRRWRELTDPRILLQAGIKIPVPQEKTLNSARRAIIRERKARGQEMHLEQMAQAEANKARRQANIEKTKLARESKRNQLFNDLFYPTNGPSPF